MAQRCLTRILLPLSAALLLVGCSGALPQQTYHLLMLEKSSAVDAYSRAYVACKRGQLQPAQCQQAAAQYDAYYQAHQYDWHEVMPVPRVDIEAMIDAQWPPQP